MEKKVCIILAGLLMTALLVACGPSEEEMQATVTQVAAELYGTQTALAPTATPTHTPTVTPTSTPTATSTNTPLPPTPTLTADGVEKLMLCYKAAVSIQADWEVHRKVTDTWDDGKYRSTDQKAQNLNAFLWERSHRPGGIKILDKNSVPLGNDTLVVDGVTIVSKTHGREDCDPYLGTIIASNDSLRFGPWGVGAPSRLSTPRFEIGKAVRIMRKELHDVYGIDASELEAIEDPIWHFVHDRYGVELPD